MRLSEIFFGTPKEIEAKEQVKHLEARRQLRNRDTRRLEEAKRISRRLFLRRAGITAGGTLLFGTGGLVTLHELTDLDLPSWITVKDPEKIGKDRIRDMIGAAEAWKARFGCDQNIEFTPLGDVEVEKLPSGYTIKSGEKAESGKIAMGQLGSAYDLTLHAMTHACKPKETILEEPIQFSDGAITGFYGLSINLTFNNGEKGYFYLIEEGMAERNASDFPEYSLINNPRYIAVGNLAKSQFSFVEFPHAHRWAMTNDVPTMIRASLGLSQDVELTGAHYASVMYEYNNAWNTAVLP